MTYYDKAIGLFTMCVGLGIWTIDIVIFKAVGSLTSWIASAVGITGMAVLGLQVLGWILIASILILLLVGGGIILVIGLCLVLDIE